MGFFLGSTSVYPGVIPTPNESARGAPLMNDGTYAFWAYPGEAHNVVGAGWRYRTIITSGFHVGGYKGSNPWRMINKMWHPTETTINLGEQLDRAAAYLDGTFSDFNGYVHGTGDAFQGTTNRTSSYSLFNGTLRQQYSASFSFYSAASAPYGYTGNNPVADGLVNGQADGATGGQGGWQMSVARFWCGTASTPGGNGAAPGGAGYIYGGGTNITNKLHFPTEVMYTTTNLPVSIGQYCGIGGRYRAYMYGGNNNAYCYYMTWSNDTFAAWAFNGGSGDSANKCLMSKYDHFYAGPGTNTDTRRWKFVDSTGAYITQFTKLSSFGEETQHMGQDAGYMLGSYNGNQTNWAVRTTYATDAQATLGPAAQCKGHHGASTGAAASAAQSITAINRV